MNNPNTSYQHQLNLILQSKKVVLSTHRNSDGDGIGSLVALYWALKQLGKQATFFPVDEVPKRYNYMLDNVEISANYETLDADLLIILDTNQGALCDPLFQICLKKKTHILFIDHHVEQTQDNPLIQKMLNLNAASTGEIVFDIIKNLNVQLNDQIATALYSSLTFDTQAFKLVKNSSRSHYIAGELVTYKINTEKIQRNLFANWTPDKMQFLAELIQNTRYYSNQTIAGHKVTLEQLERYHLQGDDINDLIDMFTLIPTVKFVFLIRQSYKNEFKISFRSALSNYAYLAACNLGGGGHYNSSGTWMTKNSIDEVEESVLTELRNLKLLN
ncbi:MAG: DHH family phosphoesterase [Pseudobdellovibrio sp.]